MPSPSQEPPAPMEAPNKDLRDMDVLCTLKSRQGSKIQIMGISKTSNHSKIQMKKPNSSQEPQAPTKAPNQDLKDMDVICTFKSKMESSNYEHGGIKDQEPPAFIKSSNHKLKDMDVLCTFKIKIDSKFGIWVYQRPMTRI